MIEILRHIIVFATITAVTVACSPNTSFLSHFILDYAVLLFYFTMSILLENLVTTGMLEGKRSRGKQREKLIEGLADWLKAGKSLEAIEATKDRKKWRTMIANAVKQGT
ncbi:hypothetical protein PoB_006795700 [Plakobranchus ocellatus]|uniref:Uncharacterized protein n=1 Tax=Plakobranchus ocellatus TaxID=259542 RepID=A0AAV4DBQ9_9GAST|nr:hypothetical protein PoB_006795700 [Plakobranchus ocellatus]